MFEEKNLKNDYRALLLDEIKNNKNIIPEERVRKVINLSDLLSPHNKKEILGKTYVEIQEDHEFYKQIASEASEILML